MMVIRVGGSHLEAAVRAAIRNAGALARGEAA